MKVTKSQLKKLIREEIKDLNWFKRLLGFKSKDAQKMLDALNAAVDASYALEWGDVEAHRGASDTIQKLADEAEAAGATNLPDKKQARHAKFLFQIARDRVKSIAKYIPGMEEHNEFQRQQAEKEAEKEREKLRRAAAQRRADREYEAKQNRRGMSAKDIGFATDMDSSDYKGKYRDYGSASVSKQRHAGYEKEFDPFREGKTNKITKSELIDLIREEISTIQEEKKITAAKAVLKNIIAQEIKSLKEGK